MSDASIDNKMCVYKDDTNARNDATYAKCTHTGSSGRHNKQGLNEFVNTSLAGGTKNWPKQAASTHNDNAKNVADDIIALTKDEKAVVAGHLAKSIEGGEVVEIRSVSSTL